MRIYEINDYKVKITRKKVEVTKRGEDWVGLAPVKICRDCIGRLSGERPRGRVVRLISPDNVFALVWTADVYYLRGGMKCGECGRLKADLHFKGIHLLREGKFIEAFSGKVIPIKSNNR